MFNIATTFFGRKKSGAWYEYSVFDRSGSSVSIGIETKSERRVSQQMNKASSTAVYTRMNTSEQR